MSRSNQSSRSAERTTAREVYSILRLSTDSAAAFYAQRGYTRMVDAGVTHVRRGIHPVALDRGGLDLRIRGSHMLRLRLAGRGRDAVCR